MCVVVYVCIYVSIVILRARIQVPCGDNNDDGWMIVVLLCDTLLLAAHEPSSIYFFHEFYQLRPNMHVYVYTYLVQCSVLANVFIEYCDIYLNQIFHMTHLEYYAYG